MIMKIRFFRQFFAWNNNRNIEKDYCDKKNEMEIVEMFLNCEFFSFLLQLTFVFRRFSNLWTTTNIIWIFLRGPEDMTCCFIFLFCFVNIYFGLIQLLSVWKSSQMLFYSHFVSLSLFCSVHYYKIFNGALFWVKWMLINFTLNVKNNFYRKHFLLYYLWYLKI